MSLDPARFDDWFRALNNLRADQGPFPWQRMLFEKWLCPSNPAEARWPRLIKLPTASGKTAIIDLAVLALAVGSPCARRRIAFVVDRRVVVDEAALRARAIAERLRLSLDSPEDPLYDVARALVSMGGEEPLVVATLRGGIPGDDGWARSPAQPAVVLSTVDQVGSRLLFRAYGGHGPRSWPIHAGLLGRDTVVIIDEAHCSAPFCETARAVVERWQDFAEQKIGEPLALVRMSATPGEEPDFELEPEDRGDEILNRRLRALKVAELLLVEANRDDYRRRLAEAIVERAHRLLGSMTNGVVGIVVNRVASARAVFEQLQMDDEHKILLTGRVRGWERDRLLQKWLPRLRAGSREEVAAPLAVVATQCIEVGANLDFDALVTEIASLDALRQRFGRLNRLGERTAAPAVIMAASRQIQTDELGNAKFADVVYGQALRRTWAWLNEQAQGEPACVDFGIDALESILPEGEALQHLCQDVSSAYPLLPAHLDLLAQTSPPPEPEPEISAFLHGTTQASQEVTVLWRCDLPPDDPEAWPDRVAVQPPVTGEGCPVPIWEFRRWLAGGPSPLPEDAGDIETVAGPDGTASSDRPVLRWRGINEALVVAASEILPGDTVVVPSAYGGCDGFGWNPGTEEPVPDIGDAVAYTAGRRPVLRLEALASFVTSMDAAESLEVVLDDLTRWSAGDEDAPHAHESLSRLAEVPELPDWLTSLARSLGGDRRLRLVDAAGAYAIVGRRGASEDLGTANDGASLGVPVPLADHSTGVRGYAERFAKAAGLHEPLVADVALAGWLHDVGKADPRFQTWLHGGDEVAAALAGAPLAKSAQNPRNRAAIRRARERARYPLNGRHEVQSLALIAGEKQIRDQAHDWDLVQHLVVSHHGFGRPLVPVVNDSDPVLVTLDHGPLRLAHTSDHLLYRIDSGVAERYWRLVRRYGWWGLAWIEAILRLADHRRSQEEERGEVDDD
jgi:CRISPR-associated endonuclease/helicase Cas3